MKSIIILFIAILTLPFAGFAQTPQDPQIIEQAIAEGRAIEEGPQENYIRTEANGQKVTVSSQKFKIFDSNGNENGISKVECVGYCLGNGPWTDAVCWATEGQGCQQQRAYCTIKDCKNGCEPVCYRTTTSF